jgi:hypothetical protein
MMVSLVDQELLTIPKYPRTAPVLSGIHVAQYLIFYAVCLQNPGLSICHLFTIVLSVLRDTASDYTFGTFSCIIITLS